MRRAAIVVNPKNASVSALRSTVESAEGAAGWDASSWFFTTVDEPGDRLARRALDDEPDVVIVVGGDGTIRSVAGALQGSSIPMTIVPTGTGNLLARNIGLPLSDLPRAVGAAFDGDDRSIDLVAARLVSDAGDVTEHIFLAMAGIGLDAAMAVNSDGRLKSLLGWIAYVPPIARSILSNQSFTLRPRLDSRPRRTHPAHTMIVGNCGVLTGDIVLMPAAVVDDGLLDVVILRPGRLIGWTPIAIRLIINGIVYRRSLRQRRSPRAIPSSVTAFHAQGTRFEADFDKPQLIELDGDIVDHVKSCRFELLPGRLLIRVPNDLRLPTVRPE